MTVESTYNAEFTAEVTTVMEEGLGNVLGAHGYMLESFTGMAHFVDDKGDRRFVLFTPDDQLHMTTTSMTAFMHAWQTEIQRLGIVGMLREMDGDE